MHGKDNLWRRKKKSCPIPKILNNFDYDLDQIMIVCTKKKIIDPLQLSNTELLYEIQILPQIIESSGIHQ
jgi:hypothetical protein